MKGSRLIPEAGGGGTPSGAGQGGAASAAERVVRPENADRSGEGQSGMGSRVTSRTMGSRSATTTRSQGK